jgi:DHA1 family bicyclomycin/chloramphenicol resistance-like MFS transporter
MMGLMSGSWISGRLAGKCSLSQTIALGYGVMGVAALLNVSLNLALPPSLPWSVLPIFIYSTGMSLTMPCLTILALDPFPAQRGLAASCQTFFQSGFNSVAAGLIAPALWASTLNLSLGMAGLLLAGGSEQDGARSSPRFPDGGDEDACQALPRRLRLLIFKEFS